MELKTVNIGGKDRPIKFGTNQSARYCEIRSIDLPVMRDELSNLATSDGSSIRDLLYSALWAGCKSEKIDVDFDRYDLGDWIDDMDQKEMDKAFQFLIDSEPKAEEGEAVEGEKK